MFRTVEDQLLIASELIPGFLLSQAEFETGLSVLTPPESLQENNTYTLYDDSTNFCLASDALILRVQQDPFGFFEVEYSTLNTNMQFLQKRAVMDTDGFMLQKDHDRVSFFGSPFTELGTLMLQDHANI